MRSWLGGVSQGDARVHVQASVFDYLGPVSAHHISRVKAGEALVGTLTSSTGTIVRVEAPAGFNGGLGDAGVHAFAGTIGNVTISGDFIGHITAANAATIGTIIIGGNYIGSTTTGSGSIGSILVGTNWGGTISAGGNITQIDITGVAGVGVSGGSLVIAPSSIQTSNGATVNSLAVGDDFVGSISIAGNAPGISIGGGIFSLNGSGNVVEAGLTVNGTATTIEIGTSSLLTTPGISAIADLTITSMNAVNLSDVQMSGEFTFGSLSVTNGLPAIGVVSIGDSLAAGVTVDLPADGLVGSIRINTNGGSGQFLGDVEVGSATLNTNYTTLSTDLGNGAVGLAPFNFHQFTGPLGTGDVRDCNPYHTEFRAVDICDEPTRVDEVIIDHYGPVHTNGTGPYYRVEFLPAFFDPSTGPQWIDVSSQFQVDTTRTSSSPTGNNRKVYIIAKDQENGFNAAGRFRFRPLVATGEGDKVRCSNVNGFPNVAYQSSVVSGDLGSTTGTQHHWYQFRVGLLVPDCESSSMLFENDQVNASDLAAWQDNPFEVNMDGQICAQDFALMSSAYDSE